jgi:hypothetical protein
LAALSFLAAGGACGHRGDPGFPQDVLTVQAFEAVVEAKILQQQVDRAEPSIPVRPAAAGDRHEPDVPRTARGSEDRPAERFRQNTCERALAVAFEGKDRLRELLTVNSCCHHRQND